MKATVIQSHTVHPHSVLSAFTVGKQIFAREEPVQVFVIVVEPGERGDQDAVKVAKRVALDEAIPPQDRTRALDVG